MSLPASILPHPAVGTALPLAFHPDCGHSRTFNPPAGHPYVICSSPAPVASCPDIPYSGRSGLRFNLNRRRRFGHDHFSTDHAVAPRLDDFPPDFSGRCGHNGLSLTAGEQKRRQPNKIKSFSHNIPPLNYRFPMANWRRPIGFSSFITRLLREPEMLSPGAFGCESPCRWLFDHVI